MIFNVGWINKVKEGKSNKEIELLNMEINSLITKWEEFFLDCYSGKIDTNEYNQIFGDLSKETKSIQDRGNSLINGMKGLGNDRCDINNNLIKLGKLSSNIVGFRSACDLGHVIYINNNIDKMLNEGKAVLNKVQRIKQIIVKHPYNKKCIFLAECINDITQEISDKLAELQSDIDVSNGGLEKENSKIQDLITIYNNVFDDICECDKQLADIINDENFDADKNQAVGDFIADMKNNFEQLIEYLHSHVTVTLDKDSLAFMDMSKKEDLKTLCKELEDCRVSIIDVIDESYSWILSSDYGNNIDEVMDYIIHYYLMLFTGVMGMLICYSGGFSFALNNDENMFVVGCLGLLIAVCVFVPGPFSAKIEDKRCNLSIGARKMLENYSKLEIFKMFINKRKETEEVKKKKQMESFVKTYRNSSLNKKHSI